MSAETGTVRLHRVLRAPPEKVYRAFLDPDLPGQMNVSIDMEAVACGTDLSIVQAGIPSVIPVEFCYLGWQESLTMLARIVEPDIPDGS